jgi:hypothetical protein
VTTRLVAPRRHAHTATLSAAARARCAWSTLIKFVQQRIRRSAIRKMGDDELPPLGVMELLPVVLMLLGLSSPWAPGAYTDGKMCADVPAIALRLTAGLCRHSRCNPLWVRLSGGR